jgi:predicted lactoylglutathione lyase
VHHFGFVVDDVGETRASIEAAGGKHWMGEPLDGSGFYEVKYRDPNGVVFDITQNG